MSLFHHALPVAALLLMAGCGTAVEPVDAVLGDCDRAPDPALIRLCGEHAAFVEGRPYDTVDSAIAGRDGGTVWLCPGTWEVSAATADDLVLAAMDPAPRRTVLTGLAGTRMLTVERASLQVDGVTLAGQQQSGGAIAGVDAAVSLTCAAVLDHRAERGAAIDLVGGSLFVADVRLEANVADTDGGAIAAEVDRISMERVELVANHARGDGGAVHVAGDDLDLGWHGVELQRNRADGRGGAVALWSTGPTTLTLGPGMVLDNHARGDGGAVFVGSARSLALDAFDLTIEENRADAGGGAIAVDADVVAGEVRLDGVTLHGNASTEGAAVQVASPEVTLSWDDCDLGEGVHTNVPADMSGGGRAVDGGADSSGTLAI